MQPHIFHTNHLIFCTINMKLSFSLLILTFCLLFIRTEAQQSPASWVNPFIGTGGHGHTYPGATVPFGMVQLSPDTRLEGWDGCGGYHYDDSCIYGFSHTHLNGTGVPDLCDILVMPGTGETRWNNGSDGTPGYGSHFSHSRETAEPGYYRVQLDDYGITAELTATTRAGMHSYTFPAGQEAHILFDLFHRDEVVESSIRVISNTQIEGLRRSRSWAQDQYVYFVAVFSRPFESNEIALDNKVSPGITSAEKQKNIKAIFHFGKIGGQKILVKVGISAVSTENARLNLLSEIPGWDFAQIRENARKTWNQELSKIEVEGGSDTQKTIFYTALYHTMVNPNTFTDADGSYRGRDGRIHKADGFTNYSVFSLWDTYRAFHPLMTLIDQKRTLDYIRSFLVQYDQGGLLPVWELNGNETNCMIGYHAVPVIVDAYRKGIRNFDTDKALAAMQKSASQPGNAGLKAMEQSGFLSTGDESESVSKTLEYAYDDWCIAVFAKDMGNDDVYRHYIRRAQSYKNLFDPSSGFMRARSNGGWFSPFDPFEVNFNYTEANAWQYSFSAVQDISGLILLNGGRDRLAARLDELFSVSSQTTGRDQSDISGLIGQYAHGNEPSHHMAYLYPFVGQAWKTQEMVHRILSTLYRNNPDGLSGNEDCGQMSAWAVMSAMGFYPVTPGTPVYVIGTPWFSKVTLHLENGKEFVIRADHQTDSDFYIQSAVLNGKKYTASFLNHSDIMQGGELSFSMGATPNKTWGSGTGNEPVTEISDHLIIPAPAVTDGTRSFRGSRQIAFSTPEGTRLSYRLEDENPPSGFKTYVQPFVIDRNAKISFRAEKDGESSSLVSSVFTRMADDRDITLLNAPAGMYSAGGGSNLIDGIRCPSDFRVNGWLGFEKTDLLAVIDLRTPTTLTEFGAGFLQDINAWIFMPSEVEFQISDDGISYRTAARILNDIPQNREGVILHTFETKVKPVQARFVKITGKNIGNCPPGHKGQGGPAWIFSDEIIVK
jgi:predicted alpha-1,2-mannosidase